MKKFLISGISAVILLSGGAYALTREEKPVEVPQEKIVSVSTEEKETPKPTLPKATEPVATEPVQTEPLVEEPVQTPTAPKPVFSDSGVIDTTMSFSEYFTPSNEWEWTIDYSGCVDTAQVVVMSEKMKGGTLGAAKIGDSGSYKSTYTVVSEAKDVNFRISGKTGCSWSIKAYNAQ